MQIIASKDNEKVKHIKKLKDKKYRDEKGQFIIEGIKMLEEAIKENADIVSDVWPESFYRDASQSHDYWYRFP